MAAASSVGSPPAAAAAALSCGAVLSGSERDVVCSLAPAEDARWQRRRTSGQPAVRPPDILGVSTLQHGHS